MTPINLHQAADAALAELDQWENELKADRRGPENLSPQAQYDAAVAKRIEFAKKHHRTHRNKPLDLSSGWFAELLADPHTDITVRKSVQCGVSEMLIVRELAEAAAGRNVIHVCPNYVIRNRFVALRVDRPMRMVPAYRELSKLAVGDAGNRAFKLFGDGALYYLGSNTPDQFVEAVGDTAIVDEVDRCDPENLTLLPDRLSAEGKIAAWLRVGNPTHADFGISELYDDTDRGEWQVRCDACKTNRRWRRVDWFEHVVEVEKDDEGTIIDHRVRDPKFSADGDRPLRAICPACGAAVDHLAPGRWAFPLPHKRRGYHVSKLMTSQAKLETLYADFVDAVGDATKMARFINNDLGLPYSPPGSAVTEAMLDACRGDAGLSRASGGPCTMGVDVGSLLDLRISDSPAPDTRRALAIERAPVKVDEVVGRLRRYNVKSCVIDAGPETHFCREILRELGQGGVLRHGVWLCRFSAGEDVKNPRKDPKERVVSVDRTQAFDAATARLRQRKNRLPKHARHLLDGDYYKMMTTPKRVMDERPNGDSRYVWTKGFDHARLADVYDELAYNLGGAALNPAPVGGIGCRLSGRERRARVKGARR